MKIKSTLKKIRGNVCSALAQHSVTHRWPRFWWGLSGYLIGKNARIASGCLFWAWHHLDTNNIIIEDDASIGPRVMPITRTHPISQIETYGKVTSSISGKIIIKQGAWIEAGVNNITKRHNRGVCSCWSGCGCDKGCATIYSSRRSACEGD